MKFDIIRAWKDETYRQSLSEEQVNALPANPVGELDDSVLESVQGQGGGYYDTEGDTTSYALICEINIYTINLNLASLPVNVLTGPNSNCSQFH